jgi:hypothetical protein
MPHIINDLMRSGEFMLRVIPQAENGKLGPGWSCTYRPVGLTCPADCPLLGNGCYAERGRVCHKQRESIECYHSLAPCIGAPLIRHLVSGDCLQADGSVDEPFLRHVIAYHKISTRTVGLMYTHAWRQLGKRWLRRFPESLHVLASCDSHDDSRQAQKIGWRTARVTEKQDAQQGEVYCPVDRAKWQGKPVRHTCSTCRQCFESSKNVVFLKF